MPPTSPAAEPHAPADPVISGAAPDPSMQAILVSIRRMLDEDPAAPGGPGGEIGAAPAAPGERPDDDTLHAEPASEPVSLHPGPSLEDVVREELRPMLKHWMDHQLPPLIERLVRAEIERVVRRAAP